MHTLKIENLYASIDGKEILKDLSLEINSGETHVIMGPNGVGKSTLSKIVMGSDLYKVSSGNIYYDNKCINDLTTDERAKLGLFLSFQLPTEIDGVSTADFLRTAASAKFKNDFKILKFAKEVDSNMKKLEMDKSFLNRSLNTGFSGGEKKKTEILTMYTLKPDIVLLDEIDSGLDVDSLKIIGQNIEEYKKSNNSGILLITHYQRLLEYIKPDYVHILIDGHIVKTGDSKLVEEIEKYGYQKFVDTDTQGNIVDE